MALFVTSFSFSQDPFTATNFSPATISGNYCVVLNNGSELVEFYMADASGLNWTSGAEAKKQCGYHSNNLVTFQADYANKKILVRIHMDRTKEPKDLDWWNKYLQSICN